MKTKNKFLKKSTIIWAIIIILIVVVIAFFALKKDKVSYTTESVSIGDVTQTVSVTGQIKPENSASLRFKISGVISRLYENIGDMVIKDELLARLDTQELEKKLIQAKADLQSANVALENAAQLVEDTKTGNNQNISTLYVDAPKEFASILNYAQKAHAGFSGFFDTDKQILDAISESTPSYSIVNATNNSKLIADEAVGVLEELLSNFPTSADDTTVNETLEKIHQPLQNLQSTLSILTNNVNAIIVGLKVSTANIDTYKATIATARTNLNNAIASEIDLNNDLATTKINNQLDLNTSQSDYRLKQANKESAEAAVAIAQRNLNDAYLRAPIPGVISAKNKEIGELVTSADIVYRIIDGDELEVVADIPEVDIGQIVVNNRATGTLDALDPDEVFNLYVVSIEPDQTMIDGVVHYKTHFLFDETDPRFKSGMSVNLDIVIQEATSTLMIPRRALKEKDGKTTVELYVSDLQEPEIRDIQIGIKGDSSVQVLSGLKQGEVVVTGKEK